MLTESMNIDRVNNFQLIPTYAMMFLVPVLHCPMGRVDKLLTSFLDHVWQKVLLLPLEDDLVQKNVKRQTSGPHL
jgi:hypothetical protein